MSKWFSAEKVDVLCHTLATLDPHCLEMCTLNLHPGKYFEMWTGKKHSDGDYTACVKYHHCENVKK